MHHSCTRANAAHCWSICSAAERVQTSRAQIICTWIEASAHSCKGSQPASAAPYPPQVPGNVGGTVLLRDAHRWKWVEKAAAGLPFPTHLGPAPEAPVAAKAQSDPYKAYKADIDYFSERWKGGD